MGRGRSGAGRNTGRTGQAQNVSDTALETMRVPRDSMSATEYSRFTGLQRELKDIQAELLGIRAMRNATQIRRDQRMNPINLYDQRVRAVRYNVNQENPTARGNISPYQVGDNAPGAQITRLRRAEAVARQTRQSGNIAGSLTRAAQIRRQMRAMLQPGLFG